ncbi:hypothetical protein VPH35_097166 [Triticum aestivum]|uniref:Uncharacterized protein n=3 Tax=Aegilops tauschii subsp. strangulata TaxID=200361 RepID=A0A453KGG7_AEGTS
MCLCKVQRSRQTKGRWGHMRCPDHCLVPRMGVTMLLKFCCYIVLGNVFIKLPCQPFAIYSQTSDIFLRSCLLPSPPPFPDSYIPPSALEQEKEADDLLPQRHCFLQLTILLING